ncbi:MAG: CBS domain-containing protein [Clostridiales bacterium]|nr:CBS domain-containing protein [Clostridiales bacterium]
MNVLMLLKHKDTVEYIYENNTLRQGLEKMRVHSYTAIPVISEEGIYVGTVSEGDFLWYIVDKKTEGIKAQEKYYVRDIICKGFNPAVKIDVTMDELLDRAMKQNFIPVTDDRGTFIGIVTRQDIIKYFTDKN